MTKELKNRILENKVLTYEERMEIVEALEQQPCDCVSVEVYKQVIRERDIAIEQLKELGYELGEKIRTSDNCVSLASVFETIDDCNSDGLKGIFCSYDDGERFKEYIKKLPPVTPTHGTCEQCLNHGIDKQHEDIDGARYCSSFHTYTGYDFYCADYEKTR